MLAGKSIVTPFTEEATERLRCAAEYTGMHMYELIEELIMTQVPKIEQLESDDGSV